MKEKPQDELALLLKKQRKARQDEVFGGLSKAEQAEFDGRAQRIHALENEMRLNGVVEQKRQWNKESETDTHQSEAHLPYRSREKGSSGPSA